MDTCAKCGGDIRFLGGEWTDDDGTINCYGDLSAPFTPHEPIRPAK